MQHAAATCSTHFVVHGGGGMLFAVQCASTIKSSISGCLLFRMNLQSLFCLVQLVGPVLGTSISRTSGIIGVY